MEMSAEMRSYYLMQAPSEALDSIQRMHIHTDNVLTYIAELTREVMDLRNTVAMAGIDEEG